MQPIINIITNAIREASRNIVYALERLESPSLSSDKRLQLAEQVRENALEQIKEIIDNTYQESSDKIWVINPIDGFTNYMRAIPHFSISVAVKNKDKIQHAVIYDPLKQELFTTSRGYGAALNNRRIRVSGNANIENAVLATKNSRANPFPETGEIRSTGSVTLDLVYVACGRFDGFWGEDIAEEDITAACLLMQEAGGLLSDFKGQEKNIAAGQVVAANPKIFKQILKILKGKES